MEVKKISSEKNKNKLKSNYRPEEFEEFIGQEEIKKVLKTAVKSAHKRNDKLGHMLFSGESGYGKTTLAQIVAKDFGSNIKIITGYAITKPSEIISILNSLEKNDILFIDEIHRIKPNIEEVLYPAMEDFCIDMVMPEGGNVRVSINEFCLIGATTKLEMLTQPLKNRFVYKFHFSDYTDNEKNQIIEKYLNFYNIDFDKKIINRISENIVSTPREINNFCVKLRDYITTKQQTNKLGEKEWELFKNRAKLEKGGLQDIHRKYLKIIQEQNGGPVGLKTISVKLGVNEKAVENDIEPLLMKLGKIEKTTRGRVMLE
ncbi:Holliday junction branch migration DNA helicase RuvB [Candidatus Absconditicoccus praedator]|uniref:Holliday junction branch migration DNA helicase RuvB n=1 Tax=Candidatus Absconditicoccus praedator TaxID=2735562 RepID=UPI001E603C3D|nr:Holliday junction branch migration DNA helicase RuvB [Candidatus Absconditicoccus praedator]UFX82552.1 Holliday junction branch migration DNA helicase RuvB [Candidatus Absconditicoccus praedator]